VVTLGGGYARKLQDTVQLHAQTCRMALAVAHEKGSDKSGARA
jgi:hypothetical protein